jgi:hypothetical protein
MAKRAIQNKTKNKNSYIIELRCNVIAAIADRLCVLAV